VRMHQMLSHLMRRNGNLHTGHGWELRLTGDFG
jgi:hypothetical protein